MGTGPEENLYRLGWSTMMDNTGGIPTYAGLVIKVN